MFIFLPISGTSKEQTTLLFAAPCFSQRYVYTRTMSGLFICFLTVKVNKLIATVLLNLPKNKCIIQPSEYEFNLIFLPGPPGDIITSTSHGKHLGRGAGIHLQDPSTAQLLFLSSSTEPRGWLETLLALQPPFLNPGMPSNQQLPTSQSCHMEAEGNWLVMNTYLFLLPLQTQLFCFFH